MRLSIFLFFAFIFAAQASSYSQSSKLTLDITKAKLVDVLDEIEEQTDYYFYYNLNLDDYLVDRVKTENQEIREVLDLILPTMGLTYEIIDRYIVIKQSLKNELNYHPSSVVQQQKTVSGKVTDKSGQPLPGVTVLIKGTTSGTITGADGSYRLEQITAGATLAFSFVGMSTCEVVVGNQSVINVSLTEETIGIEEVVAIGYGTMKKTDLTGSITRISGSDFKTGPNVQVTDMLAGTIAGLNAEQGTSAKGGASFEIRGPTSLNAGTDPLIVLDGVIFNGNISEINPYDVESVDVLKDASSAAVFGSKAASGVIIITTTKGRVGKPTINFSAKVGVTESNNERRGLNPEEFIEFRQDYLKQINPNINPDFYTHPDKLPLGMTLSEWRTLSPSPLTDNVAEWMARIKLYPEEQANYLAGKTMDMYDEVFRLGIRQDYDLSISGGTDAVKYYWSVGYNNNEGIIVGDQYSSVRTRLNVDFKITEWLNAGLNAQFADRDAGSVPASMNFYANSPYGDMLEANGNLKRLTDGHTDNPLLEHYRTSLLNRNNSLFANMYAEIKLPCGIKYKMSYQPRYEANKYYSFTTISPELGGMESETPFGERNEYSTMNWMVDNLLTWNKEIGIHRFDVTLLANMEKNQFWSSSQTNRNFQPNQELGYHGMQYGDSPGIYSDDAVSTGDAYMARMNYSLLNRYLLTASVRRDGYSAFGQQNPRATFPAFALAWVISEESFFKVDLINRLKIRLSWGVNGNRDIGTYSALANTSSILWYDGANTRIGVQTSSLANAGLRWERTESLNLGLDIVLLKNRIDFTADMYDMTTTNLLMNRRLPRVTGFGSIMSNLGELGNRGFEMALNTININRSDFSWKSTFIFSFNRNKIKKLFSDMGTYTLLGKEKTGELPDYSNEWFPGRSIDVIWDYDIIGIWQTNEAAEAAKYNLEPGDFKAVDVDRDGKYINLQDKKFIGYEKPRYRLGMRNDFSFLKNFTTSIFIRADLGHLGQYRAALNEGWVQNDCQSRINGPVPYWTKNKPNNEYARLNTSIAGFGGGLMIYKPRSFVRVQDVSLTYNLPRSIAQRIKSNSLQVFGSVRNLLTFTKWPGWDPESGMAPMPRTFTLGINLSL